MRILISNPDTIGDVVLRQPLFAALTEAGHELMLVVQPLLVPIMGLLAPGARVLACSLPAYDARLGVGAPELEALVSAAQEFRPEVFVVAPYQWTVLEERLAFSLPDAKCIAMSGQRFGDPHHGPAPRSRMDPTVVVEVARDLPELKKNERMAGAVLGRSLSLPDPVVKVAEAHTQLAAAALARVGLSSGGYWIACVGDTAATAVRNWGVAEWGGLLGRWAREHEEKFLFVGLEAEAATFRRVREAMGEAGAATAEWLGQDGGDLETLVGLIGQSKGYVGRDTGPMHLAAAMDKPVAAVFGGGTWPRFVPAGLRSVAVTVGVPCAGCEWRCHLPESYCIKRVPADEVWRAVEEVRAGKAKEPRARVLPADVELLSRIGREGAASAQRRLVQASVARRELAEERKSMSESGVVSEGATGLVETLYGPEPKPGAFREAREARREESVSANAAQLQARLTEAARQRGEMAAALESAREQLAEVKARARDLENRLERRVAELLTATAEHASLREKHSQVERLLASTRREADQVRQQGDATNEALQKARTDLQVSRSETAATRGELQAAKAELQQAHQRAAQSAGAGEAALRAKEQALAALQAKLVEVRRSEAALKAERDRLVQAVVGAQAERDAASKELADGGGPKGRLATVNKALGKAQADLHDLRARAKRLEADRAAMARLTRQHETTIATLESRLHDLMASRWRKYGQRAGIVMTLPWEDEMRNGRA